MTAERILEHATPGPAPLQIDREKGIIRGVKVLGERSLNPAPRNNVYPRTTREKAIAVMDGGRVYVNHQRRAENGETRDYREGMGLIKNLREQGDGLYGDWHFNPKAALAEQVFWDAQNAPQHVGFSIDAEATNINSTREGRIVEGISRCDSMDLVSRPATTGGLFESRSARPVKKRISEILQLTLPKRKGYLRGLKEAAESGIMSPDYQMDQPAEDPDAGDDENVDHEKALIDAGVAILKDSTLDTEAKLKKLAKLFKIIDSGDESGGGDDDEEDDDDEEVDPDADSEDEEDDDEEDEEPPVKKTKESRAKGKKGKRLSEAAARRQLAKLKSRDLLRSTADAEGVKVPASLLESVSVKLTEAQAKALVADLKATNGGGSPAAVRPGARSGGGDESVAAKLKESLAAKQGGGGTQTPAAGEWKFEGEKANEQRLAKLRGMR